MRVTESACSSSEWVGEGVACDHQAVLDTFKGKLNTGGKTANAVGGDGCCQVKGKTAGAHIGNVREPV